MNFHRGLLFLGLELHNYAFIGLFTVWMFPAARTYMVGTALWAVKGEKPKPGSAQFAEAWVDEKEGVFLK